MELKYTLESIDKAVKQFWDEVHNYHLFAFSGEMGAGKTTFIHKLCDYLHVEDVVSSPTFALINEYHFTDAGKDKVIYHLDWYRLRSSDEAVVAGMEDCINMAKRGEAYCFIEWPEKAKELLTPPYFWISIATTTPQERTMSLKLIV